MSDTRTHQWLICLVTSPEWLPKLLDTLERVNRSAFCIVVQPPTEKENNSQVYWHFLQSQLMRCPYPRCDAFLPEVLSLPSTALSPYI